MKTASKLTQNLHVIILLTTQICFKAFGILLKFTIKYNERYLVKGEFRFVHS